MPSSVMLPLFAHAKAVVLSVPSSVCSKGRMWLDLTFICVTCAASSRLFMLGALRFVPVAIAVLMSRGRGSCHT